MPNPDWMRGGSLTDGALWIPMRRDAVCCDHHFSNGINEMTVNSGLYPITSMREMVENCPYAQLERFHRERR